MYEITNEKFIRNITNSSGQRTALLLVHIVCDTAADMPEPLPHWISGSRCDVLEICAIMKENTFRRILT